MGRNSKTQKIIKAIENNPHRNNKSYDIEKMAKRSSARTKQTNNPAEDIQIMHRQSNKNVIIVYKD
jgi:hypothetical protein